MSSEDRAPQVRELAYYLWEKAGRPCGREHEFWAEASREIEAGDEEERDLAQAGRSVAR